MERGIQCVYPSRALPYLHVAEELDFKGLFAVLCQEVIAVVGDNQVDKGVVLKHGQFQVEILESKLWDECQASVSSFIRPTESL